MNTATYIFLFRTILILFINRAIMTSRTAINVPSLHINITGNPTNLPSTPLNTTHNDPTVVDSPVDKSPRPIKRRRNNPATPINVNNTNPPAAPPTRRPIPTATIPRRPLTGRKRSRRLAEHLAKASRKRRAAAPAVYTATGPGGRGVPSPRPLKKARMSRQRRFSDLGVGEGDGLSGDGRPVRRMRLQPPGDGGGRMFGGDGRLGKGREGRKAPKSAKEALREARRCATVRSDKLYHTHGYVASSVSAATADLPPVSDLKGPAFGDGVNDSAQSGACGADGGLGVGGDVSHSASCSTLLSEGESEAISGSWASATRASCAAKYNEVMGENEDGFNAEAADEVMMEMVEELLEEVPQVDISGGMYDEGRAEGAGIPAEGQFYDDGPRLHHYFVNDFQILFRVSYGPAHNIGFAVNIPPMY